MSHTYRYLLLACSSVAIVSEIVALLFPGRMLALMEAEPATTAVTPFLRVLGVLSLVYMADIVLLLFSGDTIFQAYAVVLIAMAMALWAVRKRLAGRRYVLMFESAVCLILLIDVVRSILKLERIIPV